MQNEKQVFADAVDIALAQALVWEADFMHIPAEEFANIVQRVRARLELQGWKLTNGRA